jgi:Glycosyl hydrolase catalytic core
MRRLLLTSLALAAGLAALPTAAGAVTVGVSDQQASAFTNPLFKPLKFKQARYITPYDVIDSRADRAALNAWIAGARATHQKILISFEHSHRSNARALKAPSVAAFTKELKKFKSAYPDVKLISPWNEVNRCHALRNGSVQGQPTKICKGPKLVAQYYMAARKVFAGSKYTILGVDVLDENNVNRTITFLKSFLRYAKPTPKVIGFHNYSDTNRFSTTRTKRVLATFHGKVWLTETGGIVKLGTPFPYSTSRAKKALGCMFTLAKSNSRIQALFVYQFSPALSRSDFFDAGLINPDGSKRPGYTVVKDRKASACHK